MPNKNPTAGAAYALLKDWCKALLRLQIRAPGDASIDGALHCPSCGRIHGRSHEAVYPLLFMARAERDARYLSAARALFRWGENMRAPDGSMLNDHSTGWKGTTVFSAIALHDALYYHGDLLEPAERGAWEERLRGMGEWLHANLRVGAHAYINYYAANACAMALLGAYFGEPAWSALSDDLADYCLRHVSQNGILFGEGRPHDAKTAKGCIPVDIGYNAEESLPALFRYATARGNGAAVRTLRSAAKAHLRFLLPDGGWDNSFGTRAFKWTYWGGRTSDGSADLLAALGKNDPVFADALARRVSLLRRCTVNGLLTGGPGYARLGERPCVHHTFCCAKSVAAALDAGIAPAAPETSQLGEGPFCVRLPETDTFRLRVGGWLADITAYDFVYKPGSHTTGGTLSLLWHDSCGPVLAAGPADYLELEPNNQQPPAASATHRSVCMRVEAECGGVVYAQHKDHTAVMKKEPFDGGVCVSVRARLLDLNGAQPEHGECAVRYTFTENGLSIRGGVSPEIASAACLVLPLIAGTLSPRILSGRLLRPPERVYCLSPGFLCEEFRIRPEPDGTFEVLLAPK